MHEPATALTDLLLALEGAVLAILAGRTRTSNQPLRGSTVLLFWSMSFAALLGFVTHGFVPDHTTTLFTILWRTLLLSIAVAGSATFAAAGLLWPSLRIQRLSIVIAGLGLILLSVLILLNVRHWAEEFDIAIASYAPAMVFLLISFIAAFIRTRKASPIIGALSVLLSFAAAWLQKSDLHLGPIDHNALYHIVQAIALIMLLYSLRAAMMKSALQTRRHSASPP